MRLRMRERIVRAWRPSVEIDPLLETKDEIVAAFVLILGTIYARQSAGESTTIRGLYEVMGMDQRQALRLMRVLENEGLVEVVSALHDALESEITITEAAKRKLAQAVSAS